MAAVPEAAPACDPSLIPETQTLSAEWWVVFFTIVGISAVITYGFQEKAKALGYEVWIDHDISKTVNHLGCFGYNPQMKTIVGEMRYGPDNTHQEESAA